MAAPLKCPNPVCPFLFDPAQVPPGAVIACPRCGLRFNLGPTPPVYPGYAAPAAPPEPVSEFSADLFASSADGSVEVAGKRAASQQSSVNADEALPRSKGKYGSLKSILVAVGIVGLLGAVGLGFVFLSLYKKANLTREESDTEIKYPDLNLQFKKPGSELGWTKHDSTRNDFKAALFGYVKGDENAPGAWIVGDAKRLDHAAGPADLRERATELLNGRFDNVTEADDARDDQLCGRAATRFLFRASDKKTGENIVVEIHALANKAIGIWVFSWALERDFAGLAGDFQNIRSGLQIAEASDINSEVSVSAKPYRSKSGLFTVKDQDGLWAKKEPPASIDTDGTLWLHGTPKVGGKSKTSTAELVVVEIDPSGDPKEQATELVKKSLPAGESVIEELTGEPTGDPPAGELNPGFPVTRLKVRYKNAVGSVNKLLVYASVESGKKLIVAYAYCELKDRPYWEQRLMQIVGSLTPRAK